MNVPLTLLPLLFLVPYHNSFSVYRDVLKYAQVGRYHRGDTADNYDQLEIIGPEYIHPLYEVK